MICNGMTEKTPHATQKPEALIEKLVLASSKPGQLVVDPFVGSGTTLHTLSGARSTANGFVGGPTIVEGEMETTIGGGGVHVGAELPSAERGGQPGDGHDHRELDPG